jgi:hypothetical protein
MHAVDQKNTLNVEAAEIAARAPNWWRNIMTSDKKLKETFMKSIQAELIKYPELNAEQIAYTINKVESDYVKDAEVDYLDVIWDAQKKVFKRVVVGILFLMIGLVVYLYLYRK